MSTSARYKKPTRLTFQKIRHHLSHKCLTCVFTVADQFMLVLGPVLILVACAIIVGLTFVYFRVVLPMLSGTNWVTTNADWRDYWKEKGYVISLEDSLRDEHISLFQSTMLAIVTPAGMANTILVSFLLVNILYNYYKCVATSNVGKSYDAVVRDLAVVTGFTYPETEEEMSACKHNLDRSIFNRLEKRKREIMAANSATINSGDAASGVNGYRGDIESQLTQVKSTNATPQHNRINNKPVRLPKIHNWQLLSPTEWSWCRYSKQPKPPRSHYDHVTKSLVLNMDHYCPWMFNVVGYFNYRYFFNFLWFVTIALFYGTIICYPAFRNSGGPLYKEQVRTSSELVKTMKGLVIKHLRNNAFIPTPEEKTPVVFGFMMCLAVGLAVLCLSSFHLYLVVSAQTTIEFHGNVGKRIKGGWKNPYSAGNWKKNWEMIYGSRARGCLGVLLSMMPSRREPEYLPIPINGELVRRTIRADNTNKKEDIELGRTSPEDEDALTITSLDESDRSAESRSVNGLKERAIKRSTQSKEIVL